MFDPFYLDGVAPPQGFGKGFLMEFSGQPSFLTSGEMWASLDSGETQTLAAWKDGYVLRENPDGSMTAEPKFTSGIPPLTLRRVPTMGAETFASEGMDNATWFEKSVSDSYTYAKDDDDGTYQVRSWFWSACSPMVVYQAVHQRNKHYADDRLGKFEQIHTWIIDMDNDNERVYNKTHKQTYFTTNDGCEAVSILPNTRTPCFTQDQREAAANIQADKGEEWLERYHSCSSASTQDTNGNENGGLECKQEDCPENHMAVKKTDADGNETCECVSGEAIGNVVGAIGKGLGMIAIAGVLTTGILVYGIYRVIRG